MRPSCLTRVYALRLSLAAPYAIVPRAHGSSGGFGAAWVESRFPFPACLWAVVSYRFIKVHAMGWGFRDRERAPAPRRAFPHLVSASLKLASSRGVPRYPLPRAPLSGVLWAGCLLTAWLESIALFTRYQAARLPTRVGALPPHRVIP